MSNKEMIKFETNQSSQNNSVNIPAVKSRQQNLNEKGSALIMRPIKQDDRPALRNIIRKTWHYDEFCKGQAANQLAEVFLTSVEADSDHTIVIERDNKPVGVIMIMDERIKYRPFIRRWNQIKVIVSLPLSKDGRQASKLFGSVNSTDVILRKKVAKDFDAQIRFFALDVSVRGLGLGKKLFESALDAMKQMNIESFYLYTDTSCNYHFYQKRGMHQVACEHQKMTVNNQSSFMSFFLYEGKVSQLI